MRTLRVQGLEVTLAPSWEVAPGAWATPEHRERFGAIVRPLGAPVGAWTTFQVRRLGWRGEGRVGLADLRALLPALGWGAPGPLVVVQRPGALSLVATFRPSDGQPHWLREWLITDGERVANCSAVEASPAELTDCEGMVGSLRFAGERSG